MEGKWTGLGRLVSLTVLRVVVSDRCPGVAGHKVLTECLLANGFRLTGGCPGSV